MDSSKILRKRKTFVEMKLHLINDSVAFCHEFHLLDQKGHNTSTQDLSFFVLRDCDTRSV